jgi:hypothetical protein
MLIKALQQEVNLTPFSFYIKKKKEGLRTIEVIKALGF